MSEGAFADVRTHGDRRLLPFLGDTQVHRWTHGVIEDWRADMFELVEAGELAPKTVNNARIALMGFCKWAVRQRKMACNPVLDVGPLRIEDVERPYLRVKEIPIYVDSCSATYRPLARTLIGTGARISEALALRVTDFEPGTGTLHINRQLARTTSDVVKTKETKGRRRRVVYIGSELVSVLQDMLALRREHGIVDSGWLFLVPSATRGRYAARSEPRPPHRKTVHDWHEHALRDAGLADMPLHGLRHTAAAAWLSTGRSLEFVRAQLGHSSVKVTSDYYGHLEEDFRALGAAATEQAIRDAGVAGLLG
jgi:integrase